MPSFLLNAAPAGAVIVLAALATFSGSGGAPAQGLNKPEESVSDRDNPERLTTRAESLLKEDRYEEALDAAGSAVDRWPEFARAHVALADALYRRGDFPEAERHYRRAVEIDPQEAAGHFGVGRILRTMGRYGDAAESFSKAAALAPAVPRYLRTLANHLARREDALSLLRRYLELTGQDPMTHGGEDESTVRNVQTWIALLEIAGDRPISQMVKAEPSTVGLQVVKGQPYLKMTVAGLKNQRFVFDTGATGLTISPRIATRAKLTPIRPFTITGTGARRTETGDLVLIEQIAVGDGILLRHVPATVREPAGMEEGLVGPSLFGGFDVAIDLKGGRLTFRPAGAAAAGRIEPFYNVGGEIMITARVNGIPFNAMLDTGSTSTIIGRATVGRVPGLALVPGHWTGGVTLGVGGELADRKAILAGTLSVAGRDYPAGGLPAGDLSGFSRALESEVYVILGEAHLDDAPFTISYRNMTVTFAAPAPLR